ncbi:vitamin D3 receptor B-like [Amphiura filiformis]|uniref:vitamin D3 receptor B-like n=1 Tax=Amphiura filiformis TaxID=82378 RepID=UPI003B222B99
MESKESASPPTAPESSTSPTTKEPNVKVKMKKEKKGTKKDVPPAVAIKREKSIDDDVSDDSNMAPLQSEPDSTHSPTDPKAEMICMVCGDRANGMHYRALTCEGCKTFFRRNARKRDNLKCEMEERGTCEMDLYMRRHCAYCRMKKCLDVGMQVGRLWDKERLKTRKPIKKIKTPQETSADEEQVSETSLSPQVVKPPPPELSEEHQQLMASLSLAFNETMERVKEIPEKPSMSIEEARLQQPQKHPDEEDENDLTRALLASMSSMGESIAMAAQAFQQTPGGGGGSLSMFQQPPVAGGEMPKAEDIPSCSKESVPPASGKFTQGQQGMQKLYNSIRRRCFFGVHQQNQGAKADVLGASGSADSPDKEGAEEDPFTEAVYKHIMEVFLLLLKQMIAFAKTLPGFLELQCEDQASLVKGTFVEYLILTSGGIFDDNQKSFISTLVPGAQYNQSDGYLAGFSGMMEQVMQFAGKMARLKLSQQECATLYAICVLTPDRPELSDGAKQIISANQEVLVDALSASARTNHPDQPQFFPKVVNLLTELRNCTESFMDHMMQLKLKGQFIQPILGEVLEM